MKFINEMRNAIGLGILTLGLFATAPASAHEGHEHGAEHDSVKGTVEAIQKDQMTVRIADGKSVSVHVDSKTRFENEGKQGNIGDLSPGMRIVISGEPMKDGVVHARLIRYVHKVGPHDHS